MYSQKEALAQVFSCEFCQISKNTFLHRTPLMAASETIHLVRLKKTQKRKLPGDTVMRCLEDQRDLSRGSHQRCSMKKGSQNSQENTCARASFLIKFFKKETLAQVFLQNTSERLLLLFPRKMIFIFLTQKNEITSITSLYIQI